MPDKIRLWTQQGDDFDLMGKSGPIDVTRSQYAKTHPRYLEQIGNLARLVGTDQFLWCFDETGQMVYLESQPLFEWLIAVKAGRILGYVHTADWSEFIQGADPRIDAMFSKSRPAASDLTYLVEFPLSGTELIDYWDLKKGRPPSGWRPRPSF